MAASVRGSSHFSYGIQNVMCTAIVSAGAVSIRAEPLAPGCTLMPLLLAAAYRLSTMLVAVDAATLLVIPLRRSSWRKTARRATACA